METLVKDITVIEFLRNNSNQIYIEVLEYKSERDLYLFDEPNSGEDELHLKCLDFDFDAFKFELKLDVYFEFNTWHRTARNGDPEEKEIEFLSPKANIEILSCLKWNEETDEHEPYTFTEEERDQVELYFSENINL